jgi:transcriptional regulator with XRE-family HTH domain
VAAAPRPGSLAAKIDHLFRTVRPRDREFSYEEVAAAVREAGGPTISGTYIAMLRKGVRDNPTLRHLEALARFFGVPAAYFHDEEVTRRIDSELELLVALRDAGVKSIALRAAGLSPEGLAAIRGMVDHVRRVEGLPDDPDSTALK